MQEPSCFHDHDRRCVAEKVNGVKSLRVKPISFRASGSERSVAEQSRSCIHRAARPSMVDADGPTAAGFVDDDDRLPEKRR